MIRAEFVDRLLELGRRRGELPLYGSGEWEQLPTDDTRRFAAVVVAAERWRQDGEPDAVAARLRAEILAIDEQVAIRTRLASLDLSAAADWTEVASRLGQKPTTIAGWIFAFEVNALRYAEGHPPRPWPPASLACPLNYDRPNLRSFAGVPRFGICGPSCCRRRDAHRTTREAA